MSLINQVLKDLEKRHATRADVRGLPPSVRPLPDQDRRTGWLFAAGGVLLLAVALAGGWWFFLRPAPDSPPALASQPIAETPPSPISQPAAGPDQSLTAAPAPPAPTADLTTPEPPQSAAPPAARIDRPQETREEAAAASPPAAAAASPDASETKPATPNAVAARPPAAPVRAKPADRPAELTQPPDREAGGSIDKQIRPLTPTAQAESEFRRGVDLLQRGRPREAEAAWRAALEADPAHEQARQALLGALLEKGRRDEAEALLRDGLQTNPRQVNLAMLLARLQVDRGAQQEALETLLASLSNAQWSPDYLAMTAAVLARASRHREAAELYDAALRIGPNNAVWTMGLGLVLRVDGRV